MSAFKAHGPLVLMYVYAAAYIYLRSGHYATANAKKYSKSTFRLILLCVLSFAKKEKNINVKVFIKSEIGIKCFLHLECHMYTCIKFYRIETLLKEKK